MGNTENVLTKTYDLIRYMMPVLQKYPKDQKFLLGDRIQTMLLDVLEQLIEAYYTAKTEKQPALKNANLKLEKLRYLIRLSFDMKYINFKRYNFISEALDEIGRNAGAWLKSLN